MKYLRAASQKKSIRVISIEVYYFVDLQRSPLVNSYPVSLTDVWFKRPDSLNIVQLFKVKRGHIGLIVCVIILMVSSVLDNNQ